MLAGPSVSRGVGTSGNRQHFSRVRKALAGDCQAVYSWHRLETFGTTPGTQVAQHISLLDGWLGMVGGLVFVFVQCPGQFYMSRSPFWLAVVAAAAATASR